MERIPNSNRAESSSDARAINIAPREKDWIDELIEMLPPDVELELPPRVSTDRPPPFVYDDFS